MVLAERTNTLQSEAPSLARKPRACTPHHRANVVSANKAGSGDLRIPASQREEGSTEHGEVREQPHQQRRMSALERENAKLRAENAKLKISATEHQMPRSRSVPAAELRADLRAVQTPRTPRGSTRSAQTPRTPRGSTKSAQTPRTPRGSTKSMDTPRTPRAAQSLEGSPKRSPLNLGKPLRRRLQKELPQTPSTCGTSSSLRSRTMPPPAHCARSNGPLVWSHFTKQRCRIETAQKALVAQQANLVDLQTRIDDTKSILATRSNELAEAEAGHPGMMNALCLSMAELIDNLEATEASLVAKKLEQNQLVGQLHEKEAELDRLRARSAELQAQQASQSAETIGVVEYVNALRKATTEAQANHDARTRLLSQNVLLARRLHNEYLGLKGNIRVFCRLRPKLPHEVDEEVAHMDISKDDQCLSVHSAPLKNVSGAGEHTRSWDFEFDHVFGPPSTQTKIFEEISLLVQSALDGYRVAIFAYGHTGSGKTYTIEGVPAPAGSLAEQHMTEHGDAGILPRTVDQIFAEIHDLQQSGWNFDVHVASIEVYNETVYDLIKLPNCDTNSCLERSTNEADVDAERHGDQLPAGTRRAQVKDAAGVHALLRRTARARHVAATGANDRSSRSHALFQLFLTGRCNESNGNVREVEGLLTFVDLAGSERVARSCATGERLREAKHINRSLSALGDVVEALARRKQQGGGTGSASHHIPYRNSRLTMLLKDSLGGDSKALMFVNISPLLQHVDESISSLRFASKVHACKVGIAKRHTVDAGETNK